MEYMFPIVGIEALGDWSFTRFVQDHRKNVFYKILGYLSYIGILELFQKSIETQGLSWTNSAWDGWSNLTTGAVAILYFGERPSLKQFIGILLISLGLFLLGTNGVHTYGNGKR
jgi:multidrug transporter EmrE-like cation transporter